MQHLSEKVIILTFPAQMPGQPARPPLAPVARAPGFGMPLAQPTVAARSAGTSPPNGASGPVQAASSPPARGVGTMNDPFGSPDFAEPFGSPIQFVPPPVRSAASDFGPLRVPAADLAPLKLIDGPPCFSPPEASALWLS